MIIRNIVAAFFTMLLCSSMLPEKEKKKRYRDEIFEEVQVTSDVVYGKNTTQGGNERTLLMDIYEPKGDKETSRHLVIIAHGGGFYAGNKIMMKGMAMDLAKSGYVVASINYRLLDTWPSQDVLKKVVLDAVHDMRAAVRFFKKDASGENIYNINAETVFIGGYSAGACIALNYAYVNNEAEIESIGGESLINYMNTHGGSEGTSGNEGYDSSVKGVINISGALFSASHLDDNEPMLFSIHGTSDKVVPYLSGNANNTGIITEGSGLIHKEAESSNLINELYTIEDGSHRAYRQCENCHPMIREFIFENLNSSK